MCIRDSSGIGREGLTGAALQFRLHADRVGLLLCGDLRAAIEAILRSSSASLEVARSIDDKGLAAVLKDNEIQVDEALRITALVQFAATIDPENPDVPPAVSP